MKFCVEVAVRKQQLTWCWVGLPPRRAVIDSGDDG